MHVPRLAVTFRLAPVLVAATVAAAARPAAAQGERAPLRGVVVDPSGAPVAGALVEAWRRAGAGMAIPDLDYAHTVRRLAGVPTDRTGAFAIQLPEGLPCEIRIDRPPFARFYRADVLPGEELRIELQPPATFAGRVTLAPANGNPPANAAGGGVAATLRAFVPGGPRPPLGRTDADGRFRFERLPAGTFTIEVIPDAACTPRWQRVTFRAGATSERDFACEPGVVLTGRVTDAATGAPIEGAVVGEGWTLHRGVRTDRDGRYRLVGYGSSGRPDTVCSAPGFVRAAVDRPAPLVAPVAIDFALERGQVASGRLLDPDGAPAAGVYVALLGVEPSTNVAQRTEHHWAGGRTDGDGRFRLTGVPRTVTATLFVHDPDRAVLVQHLPAADDRGAVDAGTIRLCRPRVVRGVVFGLDGRPVARQPVRLLGANADRERLGTISPREWLLLSGYVADRAVRTDDHGAFAFGAVAPGTYRLALQDRGAQVHLGALPNVVVRDGVDPFVVCWLVRR